MHFEVNTAVKSRSLQLLYNTVSEDFGNVEYCIQLGGSQHKKEMDLLEWF